MRLAKSIGTLAIIVVVGLIVFSIWYFQKDLSKNTPINLIKGSAKSNVVSHQEKTTTLTRITESPHQEKTTTLTTITESPNNNAANPNSPLVKTNAGWLRGKTVHTPNGKQMDVFLGIPYAKPPVGKLRFKHPVPPEPFDGVLNVTEYGASCMQKKNSMVKIIPGFERMFLNDPFSEDCLFLNVYVPNPRPLDKSVIIYIHGGSFNSLSASLGTHNPRFLVTEENIIFVTLNYRLGGFGLMYLNHSEIEPNGALMDQLLAMKWVRDNIAMFGGDPSKVTLAGMSSGAISVGLHLISPLSEGLFQRSIQESGSALFPYATVNKKEITDFTMKLANSLDCPDQNNLDMVVECLLSADAKDIIKNTPIHNGANSMVYVPVVDGKFLTQNPYDAYEKGEFQKVDLLTGFNKDEGSMFLMYASPTVYIPLPGSEPEPTYETFEELLDYHYMDLTPNEKTTMNKFYFREEYRDQPEKIFEISKQLVGDLFFDCTIDTVLKKLSDSGCRTFGYTFTYRTPSSPLAKWLGVMHASSTAYTFGHVFNPDFTYYTETDKEFSKRVMKYWANFARTGDPNHSELPNGNEWITWPRSTPNKNLYLILNPNNQTIAENYKDETCQFPKDIIKRKHHQSG